MAVWSEVLISELQYTRIDGEFYKPEYIEEDSIWHSFRHRYGTEKLGKLISKPVKTGRTPSKRFIGSDDGLIHFIKTNTLREGRIDYSSCDFLPQRVLNDNDYAPNESVVVTIIGATPDIVGRTAIIRDVDPQRVTNQNIAIIQTNSKLDPYFLTAYFQTKFGRDQLWRNSRRTEQVNLNCREVERVIIPVIPFRKQREIGDNVRRSFSALDLSQSLYTQAEELLEKELGLDRLIIEKSKSYETSFSEVVNGGRIDSDYYQLHFKQQAKHLEKITTKPLQEIVDFQKGVEVGSSAYTETGKLFIRVSNIKATGITTGNSDKYVSEELFKSLSEYKPRKGELLLTKDGTVGVCYVVDEAIDGIISGGIMRLRMKDNTIPTEYLSLVINSQICRFQIERDCSGALIVHWKPKDIASLKIPILSEKFMKKLSDLVVQSKEAKRESEQLLAQAKKEVEDLIEGAVR